MKTITKSEAKALGYSALTTPFNLKTEKPMLRTVIRDMKRSRLNYALVEVKGGIEVWKTSITLPEPEPSMVKVDNNSYYEIKNV